MLNQVQLPAPCRWHDWKAGYWIVCSHCLLEYKSEDPKIWLEEEDGDSSSLLGCIVSSIHTQLQAAAGEGAMAEMSAS